jgi:divalent metal cation (Fe/Co/Zn/Cd) transporter
MSTPPQERSQALPTLAMAAAASAPAAPAPRDAGWLRAARQARWLSWFSLVWMMAEGIGGLIIGAEANSIGVITWAIGSAVEGAAAVIVIVRFTGRHRFSETAERRAQKWVAASFFALVPYILYESVSRLTTGTEPERSWLAIGLLGSSVVLMPLLGWAKLRLGRRLQSGATAGEGVQNLLCALQGAIAIVGVLLGSAGAGFLDPVAALVIAGIAAKEGAELWRGEDSCCTPLPGLDGAGDDCTDDDDCPCC